MRSFASDNNSGVHPDIMQAIFNANTNHAIGYGDDCWTTKAEEVIKQQFGESASPFFVFNGTGANCVALQAATRSFNSIITATGGHIEVDECGAPTKMTRSEEHTSELQSPIIISDAVFSLKNKITVHNLISLVVYRHYHH